MIAQDSKAPPVMAPVPGGARTHWRAWMPNRHAAPLLAVEKIAEIGDQRRLRQAAWETGNWPLVRCLEALADNARQRRRKAG
jgi:hypothetical protein